MHVPTKSPSNAHTYRVEHEGQSYIARAGETILEALLRGGANINFSCGRGTCQVCMLELVSGDAGPEASADLREDQRHAKLILPCRARPRADVVVCKPDPRAHSTPVHVSGRTWLSSSVARLELMAESELTWRAGQFLTLIHPSGAARSYSIASVYEAGDPLVIHVHRRPGGLVSPWLCDEVEVGAVLTMRGPSGACFYDPEPLPSDRELILVAGGTGLAPLLAVARDALRLAHTGPIRLFHGSTSLDGLYLHDDLQALARAHPQLRYQAWLDADPSACPALPEGIARGRVVDAAFMPSPDEARDRADALVYLAGPPAMVYEGRCRAVLAGVARTNTYADPFESAEPYMPDDKAKVESIGPDPELWAALDHGPGLSAILEDLYEHVFEDPRLAPFFEGVTKQRVREKQYEFLSDLFTGAGRYFGARPFNAHHWMVISDELFDYREAMMEAAIRRYGLAEHLVRRWLAVHERFRREIVKPSRRGMVYDGVEHVHEGYRDEVLDLATVCDECFAEIDAGAPARQHLLTGKLYCRACSGR